jgi:hypothetical protein
VSSPNLTNFGGEDGGTGDLDRGGRLNSKTRKALIDAFTNLLTIMYPESADGE